MLFCLPVISIIESYLQLQAITTDKRKLLSVPDDYQFRAFYELK